MTHDQAELGLEVRDRGTGRYGRIVSTSTAHVGLVSVALEATDVLAPATVWLRLEDVEYLAAPRRP